MQRMPYHTTAPTTQSTRRLSCKSVVSPPPPNPSPPNKDMCVLLVVSAFKCEPGPHALDMIGFYVWRPDAYRCVGKPHALRTTHAVFNTIQPTGAYCLWSKRVRCDDSMIRSGPVGLFVSAWSFVNARMRCRLVYGVNDICCV